LASTKAIQNANRLRYIRALERFHKSVISYLVNSPELSKEGFCKKVDNSLKVLNRVEEVLIYKGNLQDLQKLVKEIILLKDSQDDMDEIKNKILYSSNQLEKSKNSKRYKKDKHANSKYKEWE